MSFETLIAIVLSIFSLATANSNYLDGDEVNFYDDGEGLSGSEIVVLCSVISGGIFLIVVIFGLIVFCGEMDEEKGNIKSSTSPLLHKLNREFVEIEMEERSHLSNSKVKKITPKLIALPVSLPSQSQTPSRADRRSVDGMFITRKSMDEVSFKTIVEEDEAQLEDFHSLRC